MTPHYHTLERQFDAALCPLIEQGLLVEDEELGHGDA
jgi:hypothetical protein